MLSITTDSFAGYGLHHAFELAKKAGLDGIDVTIRRSDLDTQNPDYLKKLSAEYELPIVALSVPARIAMNIDKAKRALDLAKKLGVRLVSFAAPDIFNVRYKKWVQEELPSLQKKSDIKVALVNPPSETMFGIIPKYAFNDPYELKKFDDLVFDTSNVASRSEPLLEIYSILKPKIRQIHLANSRHEMNHTLLTNGSVPLESFLIHLARDKFDGILTLKFNPKSLGVGSETRVLENIAACKKFVEGYFPGE
ncbi:MAG: sugar phosphate isomerase/epimerase [Candidatus Peribacteraceae bacterium]|nr:sugar phosphate isomerase/epimerase [Candidatus Peribacteraceae bacterium]